jgi:hypothetical protein
MSIYTVDRRVDTVIVRMDIDVAEQLVEILGTVKDVTRFSQSAYGSQIKELRERLIAEAEVRSPTALYRARAHENVLVLRDTTGHEMQTTRDARFATKE